MGQEGIIYDKQQYPCRLCHLNNAQLVSRGPNCAKKISPCTITRTPPAGTLNKQDRCMLSYCSHQILTLWYECYSWNRDLSDKAMFFNLLLSSFGKPHFLFLAERSDIRCGLAAAHLLGLKCCAFRDGILYSLVVTSGNLSTVAILNESTHSPLTAHINKAFLTTQLPLDIFSIRTILSGGCV